MRSLLSNLKKRHGFTSHRDIFTINLDLKAIRNSTQTKCFILRYDNILECYVIRLNRIECIFLDKKRESWENIPSTIQVLISKSRSFLNLIIRYTIDVYRFYKHCLYSCWDERTYELRLMRYKIKYDRLCMYVRMYVCNHYMSWGLQCKNRRLK